MYFDRDLEHKKADAKRKTGLEEAKNALEAINSGLKKVQAEFLAAENSLKLFKNSAARTREEGRNAKESKTATRRNSVPLSGKNEKEVETAIPVKFRQGMPQLPVLTREERGTFESKIQSDGQYSCSLVQVNRKLRKAKDALLISSCNRTSEALQIEECLKCLLHCVFMEMFPDKLVFEVYSKAKLNRPFEMLIYDEMEDCLLSVLYVLDGKYEWRHSVPCQIPFGDFCDQHQDLRSFTVAARAYKLEEHKAQVTDDKFFHRLEGDGLLSCGLPSALGNAREPQGTLYMDGNTFVMRPIKRESKMNTELTACFEDGLIACYFVAENESLSLQLAIPNGTTVEMDSFGFIYVCGTYMDFQSQMTCEQLDKTNPDQIDGKVHSKATLGDNAIFPAKKTVDQDIWRCVLPSGTVICAHRNGDRVALFRNGNVSEYHRANSQSCQWTTTNSQGYQVVQKEGVISHEDSSGEGFYCRQGADVQRLSTDREEEFLAAESDAIASEMLDKSKALNPQRRGPIPRFFVLHEGGHGYELFGSHVFDNELEKTRKDEHSVSICQEYMRSPNKVFLHTFLSKLPRKSRDIRPSHSSNEKGPLESTLEIWPSKNTGLEAKARKHCAHMATGMPFSYSLPQVLLQLPTCKPVSKPNKFFVSYRHIREFATMNDMQGMEMDGYLAKLTEWAVESLSSSSNTSSTKAGDNTQAVEDPGLAKSESIQT